ncbi:MAG: MBL fold metallo-hydrolase [Anaerolineae bacterium]|nr:MBL fold metallo-hydrolase [Anaerolineae bacterium]
MADGTIEILELTLGPLQTNCYIIGDTTRGEAVIIDPVDRADVLLQAVQDKNWTVRLILATHGHFDHIMASADLKTATGAPFRFHEDGLAEVRSLPAIAKGWLNIDVPPAPEPDSFVREGDIITVGDITLEVLFTPGHSPGHVSYVLRSHDIVFSGDVLFLGGIGRYDLPGADYNVLMESITGKLLPLGDQFTVAPGHGPHTTIGFERQQNPYIRDYLRAQQDDHA